MDAYKTEVYKKHTIKIIQDPEPCDPRGNDNLGTMVCFHGKYDLGDKHEYTRDLDGFRQWLKANERSIVQLPLYLYDHSGITMNTTGFSCPWDSGQVGLIYGEKSKLCEEMGWAVLTKARLKKAEEILKAEVSEYDQYLTGDVYGFEVVNESGEIQESCWGFFGDEGIEEALNQAQSCVDADVAKVGEQQELALHA